jgi:hypothetical protein
MFLLVGVGVRDWIIDLSPSKQGVWNEYETIYLHFNELVKQPLFKVDEQKRKV